MQLQETLFPERTHASIKSKFERLKKTYKQVTEFESWTGNGGGDPDESEEAAFASRYEGALKAGKVLGMLTFATYKQWKKEGWDALFAERFFSPNTCLLFLNGFQILPASKCDQRTIFSLSSYFR